MTATGSPQPHVPFIDKVRQELHWNMADEERSLSTVAGAGLLGFGLVQPGWRRWLLVAVGSALLKRGITGRCDLYSWLHIDTRHHS